MSTDDIGPKMAALNPRYQRFVRGYLDHQNGTKAVIEAGFQTSGNAAAQRATKLLKRSDIQDAIREESQRAQEVHDYDREAALKEIDKNMQLALAAEQHTAASRYQELKVRMMGLLVDRIDLRSTQQVVLNLPDRASLGQGITIEQDEHDNAPD